MSPERILIYSLPLSQHLLTCPILIESPHCLAGPVMLQLPANYVPFQHPTLSSSECHSETLPPPALKSQHLPFSSCRHWQKLVQDLLYTVSEYNGFTLILCLAPLYMEDTQTPREGHETTAELLTQQEPEPAPTLHFFSF